MTQSAGRMMRGRGARAAALCVALLLLAVAWPSLHSDLQAICVLRQLEGKPRPWGLGEIAALPVVRREVTFTVGSGPTAQLVRGRMYLPEGRPNAAGMVILHGVHYLGMNEPRLMSFAQAMAGCGIRVLTPELPDIRDYHVGAGSVEVIGASARWLAEGPGTRRSRIKPVGVMGLSFSGGLALIAASEPEWRPYFRFVFAVGPHDSMERVARYYRTGMDIRPDGSVERLAPNDYGDLVLEYEYLDDFVPAVDLNAVRAVLRAHLYEDNAGEARSLAALTPGQRAETRALMDAASAPMRARIAAVLARHVPELDAVSPAGSLARLKVPVYLLHGEDDNVIPSAETLWTARDVPRPELRDVLVSPVLSHVSLDEPGPSALDELRLVRFFGRVLRAAEQN